jgi:hypothetical protein
MPLSQRLAYEKKILMILADNLDNTLLRQSVSEMAAQWLTNAETSQGTFGLISEICESLDAGEVSQLSKRIRLVALLISPVSSYPTEELASRWQLHRRALATAFVKQQMTILQTDGSADVQTIAWLPLLDSRLTGFPVDAGKTEQLNALLDFDRRLTTEPTEAEKAAEPIPTVPDESPAGKSSSVKSAKTAASKEKTSGSDSAPTVSTPGQP